MGWDEGAIAYEEEENGVPEEKAWNRPLHASGPASVGNRKEPDQHVYASVYVDELTSNGVIRRTRKDH